MKKNFWVIVLLFSIIFWGANAASFAQNQVKKDTTIQDVKKSVVKKVGVKKVEMKKDVNTTTSVVKKDVNTTKGIVKKDVTTTKVEMKKDVKEVKSVIKDKEVGKTADGKTIYEGPKGGKYTLSATGKKVYIKKAEMKKE
jgi:colicin import membrane protein